MNLSLYKKLIGNIILIIKINQMRKQNNQKMNSLIIKIKRNYEY